MREMRAGNVPASNLASARHRTSSLGDNAATPRRRALPCEIERPSWCRRRIIAAMRAMVVSVVLMVACKSSSEEKAKPAEPAKPTAPAPEQPAPPPETLELTVAELEALPATIGGAPVGAWTQVQKGGADFREVVLAGDRGWALSRTELTTFGTSDGGAKWEKLPVDQHLLAAAFGDAQHGWALYGVDTLRRTRDGGATWEDVGTVKDVRTLHAPDADTLCVVERERYKCSKDGKAWTSTFYDHGYLYVADARGWLFGTQSAGPQANKLTIWRRDDVGARWRRAIVFTDAGREPGSVSMVGDTIWMTYNDVGLVSRDAGKTWKKVTGVPLLRVHFADADHGWAVGADRVLLGTTDGGATWAPQQLAGKHEVVRWIGQAGGHTWLAGDGGLYRYEGPP
jgi:photosystem II stability/assembly factor-like uncharacterized protein